MNPWPFLFNTRCEECKCEYQVVPAEGTRHAKYMLIGERPGERENENGRPFVGKTGEEQDETYLPLAGLGRGDVYLTNTVKCWAKANKKPTMSEIRSCYMHSLVEEYKRLQPEVVILTGGSACKLVPGVWLEADHGIPIKAKNFMGTSREQWCVPMYHTAAGMHNTWMMVHLLKDWEKLGEWLENREWGWPTDQWASKERYMTVGDTGWHWLWDGKKQMGCDTENDHCGKLWSAQVSFIDGTGLFVPLWDHDIAVMFQAWLDEEAISKSFHYQEHDLKMFRSQGYTIRGPIVDTMQLAYQSQRLPQKLKALAKRVCGMQMTGYEDVVLPFARAEVSRWLEEAMLILPEQDNTRVKKFKNGKVKTVGKVLASPLFSDFKRIWTHTNKEIDEDVEPYNPWKALRELRAREEGEQDDYGVLVLGYVEDKLGPVPRPGLDRLWWAGESERAKALAYSVRDADATRRVAMRLMKENGEVGREVAKGDYDK